MVHRKQEFGFLISALVSSFADLALKQLYEICPWYPAIQKGCNPPLIQLLCLFWDDIVKFQICQLCTHSFGRYTTINWLIYNINHHACCVLPHATFSLSIGQTLTQETEPSQMLAQLLWNSLPDSCRKASSLDFIQEIAIDSLVLSLILIFDLCWTYPSAL